MLNSSKPVKFVYLKKLTNQSMLNGANTSRSFFSKTAKSLFNKDRNVLIEKKKKKKMHDEKYISKLHWILHNIESN